MRKKLTVSKNGNNLIKSSAHSSVLLRDLCLLHDANFGKEFASVSWCIICYPRLVDENYAFVCIGDCEVCVLRVLKPSKYVGYNYNSRCCSCTYTINFAFLQSPAWPLSDKATIYHGRENECAIESASYDFIVRGAQCLDVPSSETSQTVISRRTAMWSWTKAIKERKL